VDGDDRWHGRIFVAQVVDAVNGRVRACWSARDRIEVVRAVTRS
jgi:hypothetical protein